MAAPFELQALLCAGACGGSRCGALPMVPAVRHGGGSAHWQAQRTRVQSSPAHGHDSLQSAGSPAVPCVAADLNGERCTMQDSPTL